MTSPVLWGQYTFFYKRLNYSYWFRNFLNFGHFFEQKYPWKFLIFSGNEKFEDVMAIPLNFEKLENQGVTCDTIFITFLSAHPLLSITVLSQWQVRITDHADNDHRVTTDHADKSLRIMGRNLSPGMLGITGTKLRKNAKLSWRSSPPN